MIARAGVARRGMLIEDSSDDATGGDLDADGFAKIIAGVGAGDPNGHVKVFYGQTGTPSSRFFAFVTTFGGVFVDRPVPGRPAESMPGRPFGTAGTFASRRSCRSL